LATDKREPVDVAEYIRRTRGGGCFICEFVNGNRAYKHHEIWRDDDAVVFLDKHQTVLGKILVAPLRHVEEVTSDFSQEKYLALQTLIYRVAEALRTVVPTERIYICSFGSRQGNSHVHWHIVALPPGVSYERQQTQTLLLENGVIPTTDEELAELARKIAAAIRERAFTRS
jgi:diadenosine tetraphosphate (Ap4A) HIT family hydrolase